MTAKELNNKSFEEVMEQLNEEWDDVHTYESMADFVGDLILNQNDIYLANTYARSYERQSGRMVFI